jgi:hypothetical protein
MRKIKNVMLTVISIVVLTGTFCLFNATHLLKSVNAQYPYPPPNGTGIETEISYSQKLFIPLTLRSITPPMYSRSYYVYFVGSLYNLGCVNGQTFSNSHINEDVFIFLDFGSPYRNSQLIYGTTLYSNTEATEFDIKAGAIGFAEGFYDCNTEDYLTIAIGTNSSGGTITDTIAYNHGAKWAQIVTDVNNILYNISFSDPNYYGISSQVLAVGGNNIEPGFNPTYVSQHWLEGYNQAVVSNKQLSYIIASADGCPTDYPPDNAQRPTIYYPGQCYHNMDYSINWTQEDLYKVTWEYSYSMPFPEIYEVHGAHADQWHRIGIYSYVTEYSTMAFVGEMTQFRACEQVGGTGCVDLTLFPYDAFQMFFYRINGDMRIINNLKWSTDISHAY